MEEISSLLSEETLNNIKNIFEKKDKGDEFEVGFSQETFTYEKYEAMIYYASRLKKDGNKKYVVKNERSLDIILNINDRNFRLSVFDVPSGTIVSIIKDLYYKQNYVVFKTVLEKVDDTNIILIDKSSEKENRLEVNELPYLVKFKLASEKKITDTKKLLNYITENNTRLNNNIFYRYKDRVSIVNVEEHISIDISSVKTSNSLTTLGPFSYELEIECQSKGKLASLFGELATIFKILDNSEILISTKEAMSVISYYSKLNGSKEPLTSLRARNVISLEISHVVDYIANNYALTDKVDGERMFLIIYESNVYLITTYMKILKIDLKAKKEYNGTILDGEYVKTKSGKMIYLSFDILFHKGKDVREVANFKERITMVDDVMASFDFLFEFPDYYEDKKNKFDCVKISEHVQDHMVHYIEHIKELTKKDGFQMCRKIYIFPYGGSDGEIYYYSSAMWEVLVGSDSPYHYDGLIYTPIKSEYISRTKMNEYKWKPAEMNSIDFFITFEKDEKGKVLTFFDDSTEGVKKSYIICNLKVGMRRGGIEEPVGFSPNGSIAKKAYLFLKEGESTPRDIEGKIIQDNSVVEFAYDLKNIGLEMTRWVPLRSRHDKTLMANKYKKKMGNEMHVANNIWRSIHENFVMEDINALATTDEDTYKKQIDSLKKRIKIGTQEREVYTPQQRVYYEKKTNVGKPMRAFHNWIKSSLIGLYCGGASILDIACGRGGDLPKIIPLNPKLYVGVDSDYNGLFTISDSAVNRLKNLEPSAEKAKNYHFVHADGGTYFKEKMPEAVREKKFDVISIQFALHYFLKSEKEFNNLCENINTYLKNGGHLLITCFDGDKINEEETLKISYTDIDGKEVLFTDIKKLYTEESYRKNLTGNLIEVYNSIISDDGVYIKEAVVIAPKLIDAFKKKCGLNLVETDLFENLFNYGKQIFNTIEDKKYELVKKYYQLLDPEYQPQLNEIGEKVITEANFKVTKLNRYYVFQKKIDKEVFVERMLFSDLENSTKKTNMYSLDFLEKYLYSDNFYALDTVYSSPEKIKKDLKQDNPNTTGFIIIENRSDKLFIPKKNVNELIKNDSIKITRGADYDYYILVYKFGKKYYPIIYLSNGKKKIIFSNNNKYINLIFQ